MGEGLLRQRRNLMITCALLWLMKYGGATFSKFSLVGFDVAFENPNALILSIWIAFAYFLYRYYQYFSGEGVSKLQGTFSISLDWKCEPIIRHLILEKHPNAILSPSHLYSSLKRINWIYKGHANTYYDPTTGSVHDPVTGYATKYNFEIAISRWKLWKGILSAVIDSVFRNSVVTDYLLPFVLADFILYYCGTNDWSGSFLLLITP